MLIFLGHPVCRGAYLCITAKAAVNSQFGSHQIQWQIQKGGSSSGAHEFPHPHSRAGWILGGNQPPPHQLGSLGIRHCCVCVISVNSTSVTSLTWRLMQKFLFFFISIFSVFSSFQSHSIIHADFTQCSFKHSN